MRWDELFADIEAQMAAEDRMSLDAEVADRLRRERASFGVYERLAAARGAHVAVHCAGSVVRGRVEDLGAGWVLLVGEHDSQALVVVANVRAVEGLSARADLTAEPARRFGLSYALRALARDRASVRVVDVDGAVREGHLVAVGADMIDLREHPVDVPGRRREPGRVVGVPHLAIAAVLSGGW